jgi:hypothetical protein
MTTVEVACDALRADAARWSDAAHAMAAATDTAQGLDLGAPQLGAIAEDRGVVAAYAALQQKLTNLVTGAAAVFDSISTTLTVVADTYQREDEEGAHDFRQIKDRRR